MLNGTTVSNKRKLNSFQLILNIYRFLSKKRRLQILFNLFLTILSSILEIVSIAIIFPFFTLLINPKDLENYRLISPFLNYFNNFGENAFSFFITILFVFIVIFSLIIKLSNLKLNVFLSENIGSDLSVYALSSYLSKPYSFLVGINSSEVISDIDKNINGTVMAINSFLSLITSGVLSTSIIFTLLFIDRDISLIISLVLIVSYLLISKLTKKIFINNSKRIVELQPTVLRNMQESLNGIREVILSNLQDFYIKDFEKADRKIRNYMSVNSFYTNSFRYLIESIILLLICLITIYSFYLNRANASTFAVLGTIGVGAQKLIPSLQSIFRMWSNLRGKRFEILNTIKIISEYKPSKTYESSNFNFTNHIFLKNISYKYPDSNNYVLKNINLKITKGTCLGIIGESGSGKTTLADILMTLLVPTKGEYLLDGENLYSGSKSINLQSVRNSIAQVPQKIFLSDTSIAENIAFGISREKINKSKLLTSAKLAGLDKFINSLPSKFKTIVGESGSLLSGGQIQRMAIARAIYKGAKIIIFDEATSSLDVKTEDLILDSLKKIKGKVTIIFISHRNRTLSICDEIIEVKDGKILRNK